MSYIALRCYSNQDEKMDATSGFIPIMTKFITNQECFQFKRVPFGLSGISEAFQKVMEK